MHINVTTFKFGDTPLYSINGAVSPGIIRRIQEARGSCSLAHATLIVSSLLFFTVLWATSGMAYAARASYFLKTLRGSPVVQSAAPASRHALLPLSGPLQPETDSVSPEGLALTLSIPKLRVLAPIVEISPNLKNIDAALQGGVVRWQMGEGKDAGGSDATVLLGHSSAPLSYKGKYGSVFALLDKLEKGDNIFIDSSASLTAGSGGRTVYRVTGRLIIDPKTPKEDLQKLKDGSLVLISCWPVGTRFARIAVRAERVF